MALARIAIFVAAALHAVVIAAQPGVHLGPRPFYLLSKLSDGPLKTALSSCADMPMSPKTFSIGHRGAPLQFPEHTKESYEAAARMGAGLLECDVTFTRDGELVCRHAQCDLHTTTNILATPLAAKCAQPFEPAQFDESTGKRTRAASARCCASDLTLAEFKSLRGKMDAANGHATTVAQYLDGTPHFRTDLYATGGTLLSHAESIALFKRLGTGFIPELKRARQGFGDSRLDQTSYARKMIDEYVSAGVPPARVWPQSFSRADVVLWVKEFPAFGQQAVFLDGRKPAAQAASPPSLAEFQAMKKEGINIIAPPIPVLLSVDADGRMLPSEYAVRAKAAGLSLITWTAERSGRMVQDVRARGGGYYYGSVAQALHSDGDIFSVLDVLARQVGVMGVFSDWAATTTYYANCMGLE